MHSSKKKGHAKEKSKEKKKEKVYCVVWDTEIEMESK